MMRWEGPAAQIRPLVREGAPRNQERNCQTYSVFRTEIKIWSKAPDGCFIPRQTGRLTVGRNIRLRLRHPCEGGVEYLHRDTASRRRRRKGKSRV
jgi:hypothetical protein